MAKKWKEILADPKHPVWKYIGMLTLAAIMLVGVNPAGMVI